MVVTWPSPGSPTAVPASSILHAFHFLSCTGPSAFKEPYQGETFSPLAARRCPNRLNSDIATAATVVGGPSVGLSLSMYSDVAYTQLSMLISP